MNKTSTRQVLHRRAPLLQSCALALVMAVAGHIPQAGASGFQGTGTVFSGSASIVQGATSDTITVNTGTGDGSLRLEGPRLASGPLRVELG